jgi:hypothetical protein
MNGKTASLRRRFRLAPGHRLQRGPAGGNSPAGGQSEEDSPVGGSSIGSLPILMTPKGAIQLNHSAAAVLDLCNGTFTGEEIVAKLTRPRDRRLSDDVRAFLEIAVRRGWIT